MRLQLRQLLGKAHGRFLAAAAIAGLAALVGCLSTSDTTQCTVDTDCAAGYVCSANSICVPNADAGSTGDSGNVIVTPPGDSSVACTSTEQCTQDNGGKPSLCKTPGVSSCLPLTNQDCYNVIGKWDDPQAILFGGLIPKTTNDPTFVFIGGIVEKILALGVEEWQSTVGGLPGQGGSRRPLALIECDDSRDPVAAAKYLAEVVKVPAVYTFRDIITYDVVTKELLPQKVFNVCSNCGSPGLAHLDDQGLSWGTNAPLYNYYGVTNWEVSQLEQQVRTQQGLQASDQIRVAVLSAKVPGVVQTSFTDELEKQLQFNGKSALSNGSNYLRIDYDNPSYANNAYENTDFTVVTGSLLQFKPHIVLLNGYSEEWKYIVPLIESNWAANAGGQPPPQYVGNPGGLLPGPLTTLVGLNDNLRQRIVGTVISATGQSQAQAARLADYNQRFQGKYPGLDATTYGAATSVAAVMDAWYSMSYAAAAAGSVATLTGLEMADGMKKLSGPGANVDSTASQIGSGLSSLAAGGTIKLYGNISELNWDTSGFVAITATSLYCLGRDPNTHQLLFRQNGGVTYSNVNNTATGTLSPLCF